jgi:hypothetical protein
MMVSNMAHHSYIPSTRCLRTTAFHVLPEQAFCACLHAEPWSLAKERAGGEACARYSLGQVDAVVDQAGMSWEELMLVSVRRVRQPLTLSPLDWHA